jgi:hypothetical protein
MWPAARQLEQAGLVYSAKDELAAEDYIEKLFLSSFFAQRLYKILI